MRALLIWSAFGVFILSMATTIALLVFALYQLAQINPYYALAGFLVGPTLVGIGWLMDNLTDQPRPLFRARK